MKHRAFSLIELLTIIAIIGILISLTVYGFGAVAARSRDSVRKTDLEKVKIALQQYYLTERAYPDTNENRINELRCQLDNQFGDADDAQSLKPDFIASLPFDVKAPKIADRNACVITDENRNQFNHYLYFVDNDRARSRFTLLSHLERRSPNDRIEYPFGPTGRHLSPNYFNQNYQVSGEDGRSIRPE